MRANNPLPPIATKADLEIHLKEAATLEHQFMAQYLYAAFSLKKDPDDRCSDAEFEHVRRWASTIYRIARQEMEHLSVVNSILTAVGGEPYFGHAGTFPTLTRWYQQSALAAKRSIVSRSSSPADSPDERSGPGRGAAQEPAASMPPPCDIPFHLERFSLAAARRYACMESPHLSYVVPADREDLLRWCFQDPDGRCPSIEDGAMNATVPRAPSLLGGAPDEVEIGTIQDLYDAIDDGLRRLDAQLGPTTLFSGHCSGQSEIPSEYDIYLFPICDLSTALAGTRMVKTQGEGIDEPPGAESHYQMFVDIAREYEALLANNPSFEPSKPVPLDPTPTQYSDPATARAAEAFHVGYFTLLAMLTGYYSRWTQAAWSKSPYLLKMLEQGAFAPMMTMLIRSLAEVVTLLPANDGGPAGISFDLAPRELALLGNPEDGGYGDILFYAAPLDDVVRALEAVLALPVPEDVRGRLAFIVENVSRMVRNLVYNYQQGIYPRFDSNNPDINCKPATGCDCE
jgi:hypothetical protein